MFLSFIFLSTACNNDDDIDCALFDPIIQQIFIELVDEEGNNLIENGTFDRDEISVRFNDFVFTGVVFDSEGIENLITLTLFGSNGDNTFFIDLSNTETDIMVTNLTQISETCGVSFFELNSITYNGEVQTVLDDGSFNGFPRIRVVR